MGTNYYLKFKGKESTHLGKVSNDNFYMKKFDYLASNKEELIKFLEIIKSMDKNGFATIKDEYDRIISVDDMISKIKATKRVFVVDGNFC